MANTITGKILVIGQTETIPVPNSPNPFYKRELVLDASRFDQFSGQRIENYPKLEFVNNNCSKLDQYQVGQLVTVSFSLSGRKTEKDGIMRFFTNVTGYDIVPYQRRNPQQGQMSQQPQQVYQGQQPYQAAPQQAAPAQPANPFPATAPTGQMAQQAFPPAVDEHGNPIGENPDDLPF